MQLLSMHIENFGLFADVHQFDLAPQNHSSGHRPLTIFVGHNGAGKTTLFTALLLALHGPLALGNRVGQAQYNDFLYSRMHRRQEGGHYSVSQSSSVALSFEYVQSGIAKHVHIERRWRRTGRIVDETLEILQDGQRLATEASDAQSWINDFLPPGVARLCFFDAEDLDSLVSTDQRTPQLGETMQRLLGLDLIQRLQADLRTYLLREGGDSVIDEARKKVLGLQAELETLDERLGALENQAASLRDQIDDAQVKATEQERQIAAAGGLYAARRSHQQDRLIGIRKEIDVSVLRITDLAAHLLPFAMAPRLGRQLLARVTSEAEAARRQIAQDFVQERLACVANYVADDALWAGLEISHETREELSQRLELQLQTDSQASLDPTAILHHFAVPEREQLQSWIHQALEVVPVQAQEISEHLLRLQIEQRNIERDLQRAPEDEQLAPMHEELTSLLATVDMLQHERTKLDQQIGGFRYERDRKGHQMDRATQSLAQAQASEQEMVLAKRCRSALRIYEDTLTRHRLAELEKALVRCFNSLCQKEHLLGRATISPDDFLVKLQGSDGREISLSSFSAGERQLYALALLQALREVSGRRLPLLIDTPLARLDEQHRSRLLRDYIPVASDQILLFATDVEADAAFFTHAEPYLAHAYRLRFDSERGSTQPVEVKLGADILSENAKELESSYAV